MVNLISPAHSRKLYALYYARLAATAGTTLALALTVVAVLMLPSYFIIHAEADQAAEYVRTAEAIANERAKTQSQEALAAFNESVRHLQNADRRPAFGRVLAVITEELPRGVSLVDISTTYPDTEMVRATIRGTARTRAELIAYSNTLKRHPELVDVVVPVSDLVADVDSTFTVTATWVRPKKP
jgi:hypothetical protein